MKTIKQRCMNPSVIKSFTLGALLTTVGTFTLISLGVLPATPTMEILATIVAFVVASICLRYVYLEHRESEVEEREYVLSRAQHLSSVLEQKEMSQRVKDVLSTQPSDLLRIQALQNYKKDRLAVDRLIKTISHENIAALSDVGFDWCPEVLSSSPVRSRIIL